MKYLFGPVPSRRLGISLGVDLVPHKVCTLDCVYCEVGKTTCLTIERKEFIPLHELLEELKEYLDKKPELDFITFSGQGEPTLNSGLGKVIDFLKTNYPEYKIALITNGTLFYDKNVRDEVLKVDLILPSLDAVSSKVFNKINRPDKNLNNDKIINGLIELGKEFKGKIYLEVFFIPNVNDSDEELILLKENIEKINPDLVQLNSLDRPGTEASVKAMQIEKLEKIKQLLKPLPVKIIAKVKSRSKIKSFDKNIEEQILDTIKRRPCTDIDLCEMLNIHMNELNKYLSELLNSKKIISDSQDRGIFFKIK